MAMHIKSDGGMTLVEPANGRDFSLTELQKFVGGYIDLVRLPDDRLMVVNDEGLLLDLPMNHTATRITSGGYIAGDVLVCKASEVK